MATLADVLEARTAEAAPELVERISGNRLRCYACGHQCPIPEGAVGVCKVRFVKDGALHVPWGYVGGIQCDPIEKKPFFHAHPGALAFSFGMLGCDLHCGYCQNWVSSQALRDVRSSLDFHAITPHEQARRLRTDPPNQKEVRNAIERVTIGATRIEILLNESVVAEGLDRALTLPWTRPSSRRRREIIQRVGEAQQPLRAMRTKAREGFIKALRDARRWLDELLFDPAQTIESLAVREGKSERSIRMTLSLAFMSPALAEAAMEGRLPRGFCIKRLTDLPMLWSEQWRAIGLRAPAQVRAELH